MSSSEQQCAFRSDGIARKQLAVSIACPYELDQVWTKLNPTHDIVLELECEGEVFYRHSCRAANRSGSSGDDDLSPEGGTAEILALAKAADAGDAEAAGRLATAYASGKGVQEDPAKAVHYMRQAAEGGQAGAQVSMSSRHLHGTDVPKDMVLAYAWGVIAAEGRSTIASSGERLRDEAAAQMTPDQLAEANAMAKGWSKGSGLQRNPK
jgi:hypothetical protein